jgi:hypothetical protein
MWILYYLHDPQSKYLSDLYILSLYLFIHRHIIPLALCSQRWMILFRGPFLIFIQDLLSFHGVNVTEWLPLNLNTLSLLSL